MITLAPMVTAPTALPITLDEIKAQTVVDFSDDDVLLGSYIRAASGYLDGPTGIMGRAIMAQTVVQRYGALCKYMAIPYGSVSSVQSVQYYDKDNALQTLTGFTPLRDGGGDMLYFPDDLPATYERPDAVIVTYTAGYADADSVPFQIKQAIALTVAHWYNQREAAVLTGRNALTDIPLGVADMLAPLRRVGV